MRKVLPFFLCILTLNSCAFWRNTQEEARADAEHNANVRSIENEYNNCISNAEKEEDKQKCSSIRNEALKQEEMRYKQEKDKIERVIKERAKAQDYQEDVLEMWGWSQHKTKIADYFRVEHQKNENYSFDAMTCISELLSIYISNDGKCKLSTSDLTFGKDNCEKIRDKNGIQVVENELPKYKLSVDLSAEDYIQQYYDQALYSYSGGYPYPHTKSSQVSEDGQYYDYSNYFFQMGSDVEINGGVLEHLGYIEKDIVDNQNKGNTTNDSENTISEQIVLDNQKNQSNSSFEIDSNKISQLSPSGYKLNSVNLTLEQEKELDKAIDFLKKYPNTKITVIGHTCSIGSDEVNNLIGLRRAESAKAYLVKKGTEEERINCESKGESEHCSSNDTEEGRLQNRRITFIIK